MKTNPTIEQWKEAASLILLAEKTLNDLFKHPVIRASKSTRKDQLRRAMQTISRLKSNLDSDVCSAFRAADDSIVKIFYPLPGNYHESTITTQQQPNEDSECWFFDEE